MNDRGMKKWAPYKSLPEHEPSLLMMKKKKEKIVKPQISSEQAEEINYILTHYQGESLLIRYFDKDHLINIANKIKRIDGNNEKIILINNIEILFKNIIRLEMI